ncbi:dihydrofolate reductase [Propioniciclava soli]|uniref:dihydrofolate reductase n=1 Tax=Propioniciclava soli TaxID=2775081 RepID=A0ABZ3C4K0_9ACTN
MATKVVAIAIVASNGVLGDGEKQPFSFAEDWARYKRVTLGHPMVMGRATHDAIGRWLPGRTTIVVTRTPSVVSLPPAGSTAVGLVATSVEEALAVAAGLDDVVYVAGGGEVYRQAWPWLTELDMTEVPVAAEGSVTFPEIDPEEWMEVRREAREGFDFVGYERRGTAAPLV